MLIADGEDRLNEGTFQVFESCWIISIHDANEKQNLGRESVIGWGSVSVLLILEKPHMLPVLRVGLLEEEVIRC